MPRVKLTARGVASLTTTKVQEEFFDTLTPGLALRVGRGGAKTWMVRYRAAGRYRRHTLGKYPHLTLAAARDRARKALADAQAGEDPAEERRARRQGGNTFRDLAEEVLEAKAGATRPRTNRERRRVLELDILPAWGRKPASKISRRDVVELVDGIAARAPVQANRTLALIKVIFNTGLRRGFPGLESSPAHLVAPPGQENGRDRYLSRNETRAVWVATAPESPVMRVLFRLALLTAQRMGSLTAMRWDQIDGDVWRIPAESFKGKRPHLVPLSPEALQELDGLRILTGGMDFAFPGRADAKLPHVTNSCGALERIRRRSKAEHWVAHDFRTTFRTWATRAKEDGGLGVAPHVADIVLGHAEATLGWNRYQGDRERYLLHEKRVALVAWGRWVAAAVK